MTVSQSTTPNQIVNRPNEIAILGEMVDRLLTEDLPQQDLIDNQAVDHVVMVEEQRLIPFPDGNHFAEGFVIVDEETLWFPLNTGRALQSGLWEYKISENAYTLLCAWPDQRWTVFGGVKTQDGKFAGCIVNYADVINQRNIGAIVLIDPVAGQFASPEVIRVPGGPNDVCTDVNYPDIFYVATNVDDTYPCGAIYKVILNLESGPKVEKIDVGNLIIASGVYMSKANASKLYIGTLPEVVTYNLITGEREPLIRGENEASLPLFDNIRQIGKGESTTNTNLVVSVYAYQQSRAYVWLEDEILRNFVWKIQSLTMPLGVSVEAHVNLYRDQNKSRIIFYLINPRSTPNLVKSCVFDRPIMAPLTGTSLSGSLDGEVTNIDFLWDGRMVLSNYKSNYFAIVRCLLPQIDDQDRF